MSFASYPDSIASFATVRPEDIVSVDLVNRIAAEVIATNLSIGEELPGGGSDYVSILSTYLNLDGTYRNEWSSDVKLAWYDLEDDPATVQNNFGFRIPTPSPVTSEDEGTYRSFVFSNDNRTLTQSAFQVNASEPLAGAVGLSNVVGEMDDRVFWCAVGCVYNNNTSSVPTYEIAQEPGTPSVETTPGMSGNVVIATQAQAWPRTNQTQSGTPTYGFFAIEIAAKRVPAGYWQYPPVFAGEVAAHDII